MKKRIKYLTIILFLLSFGLKAQQSVQFKSFEIFAEAHGFMCPFLTPKYIKQIQSMDSCKVWKTDDLIIHVEFLTSTEVTSETLLNTAEKIGYERKNIFVKELN